MSALASAGVRAAIASRSISTSTLALLMPFDSLSIQPSFRAISPRTFDMRWRIVKLTLLWFGSTAHFIAWSPPGSSYLLLQPFTVQQSVEAIYSHGLGAQTDRDAGLACFPGRSGHGPAPAGSGPDCRGRHDAGGVRRSDPAAAGERRSAADDRALGTCAAE